MGDGPEKKKRKLTAALKEAIGAHAQKTEDNIDKPIALALISDDKSAQSLLNKIQATRRPQAVLETTLKICNEKKTEALVGEPFLSVFRKHFAVLGIDSAITCWKLLEKYLETSKSRNEITIACEFVNATNLLGHGFGKLLQIIKSTLPSVIKSIWNQGRKADSQTLAYSLACLTVSEDVYGDAPPSQSPSEHWKAEVITEKSMRKDFGMRMISALTGSEDSFTEPSEISESQLDLLSTIFLNHLEFFSGMLHPKNCETLLAKNIEKHLAANELKQMLDRIRSAEVCINPILHRALLAVLRGTFELTDVNIVPVEHLESLRLKDVCKMLPSVLDVTPVSKERFDMKSLKQLSDFIEFVAQFAETSYENKDFAAFYLLAINISIVFELGLDNCESTLKCAPKEVIDRLAKAGKGCNVSSETAKKLLDDLKTAKESVAENGAHKFVNRSAQEVIESIEEPNSTVCDVITLLRGVHTSESKKEVFDSCIKFIENLPGGESLDEITLFQLIVEMYGGGPLESLALQLVLSRLAADGWTEMDRSPGTDQSEKSWFELLVQLTELLETCIKTAKSSILKSFTALFCQLFSHLLKNTQKFARHSSNAVSSQTLSAEATKLSVLRRHKLIQDVARLVDAMKRNESYFAMLTASIIGDAVFYGSDSLLAMSKLHSVADKNASALLATNLPAVERTRYKKFLSTITRASKRVY